MRAKTSRIGRVKQARVVSASPETMAAANTAKNIKHPVLKGFLIGLGCATGVSAIGIAAYCGYFYGSPKDNLVSGIHDNNPSIGYVKPSDDENYYEQGSSNNGSTSKDEINSGEGDKAENDPNREDPIDPDADLSRMLKAYNSTRDELGLGR